jgi:hypothetical protein
MLLSKLNFPKEIKQILIAPIPSELIQERDGGGGKKLSYISGSTVTDMLNHAFGYMWNWEVEKEWVQEGKPFFNTYSKLPEKITNSAGKQGTWDEQGSVAHVRGRLTVMFENEQGGLVQISKTGYGSKSFIGKQSEQESTFKSAGTDALKKAASLFGIGLELYRGDDEQAFFDAINYDDPWTEELKAKFASQRAFLKETMESNDIDEDGMGELVTEFSDGALVSIYDIVPENIEPFVAFLEAKIAEAAAQA